MVVATMTILFNAIQYFSEYEKGALTIIGGSDGPTAIYLSINPNVDALGIGLLFAAIAGLIAIYLGKDK